VPPDPSPHLTLGVKKSIDVNVRPYRDSDLESVALLFTASVHAVAAGYYDSAQRAAWAPQPPDLNEWRQRLAPLHTLVAEDHARLAGFISYEPNGHIEFLYVSPAHARRGVASALYRHVESALLSRGVEELFTEASLAARPFFEHQGFRIAEEQTVYRRGVSFRRYAMRKPIVSAVREVPGCEGG